MKIAKSTYITVRISLPLLQTLPSFSKSRQLGERVFYWAVLLPQVTVNLRALSSVRTYVKFHHGTDLLYTLVDDLYVKLNDLLYTLVDALQSSCLNDHRLTERVRYLILNTN